jgi:uncharacterized protein (DUF1697 family)
MGKYVSLLRGINVGGRNIKMKDLQDCYASIGITDVKTYLQSGNVTFNAAETDETLITKKLELAVSDRFNYPAKIFVLVEDKLKQIIENYPFDSTDNMYQYYVIFTRKGIAKNLYNQGESLKSELDKIALGEGVLYWKVLKGITVDSPFSKLLVKCEFKDFHTNRNLKTLSKLLS